MQGQLRLLLQKRGSCRGSPKGKPEIAPQFEGPGWYRDRELSLWAAEREEPATCDAWDTKTPVCVHVQVPL